MAEQEKKILLNVDIKNSEAIKAIAELKTQVSALKSEQNKRSHSSISSSTATPNNQRDFFRDNRKRFCTTAANDFDVSTINQTELDLDTEFT